jgi:N,N-dimethylformamidase beta subunit-like protein
MRHSFTLGTLALLLACLLPYQRASAAPFMNGKQNPIVIENKNPGSNQWQIPWNGYTITDDNHLQIKGYAGNENALPGGTVALKVTVTPAQSYTVDVFRLGHYQGLGGRHMEQLGPFSGVQQPPCGLESSFLMNVCTWSTSVLLQIPQNWISGVYVAVLSSASGYQSLIPFWVVEPNRRSEMLYLSSLNTYEAYNNFPNDPDPSNPNGQPRTGHSLYDYNSAALIPAVKVTFDRPFSSLYGNPGDGGLYDFEPELISYVEGHGYDATYANEPVIDAQPWLLERHKVVVIGGHAEYQTMSNYNALIAARDGGVGLAFISGNEIYWQVRYESLAGADRRVVVGYKVSRPDPVKDPRLRTIRWRDLGRPEQKLIGVQLPDNGWMGWGGQPWVPENTNHWAFAGSGLQNGVPVKAEVSGYEIDWYDQSVGLPDGTGYTLLSASPFRNYLHQTMTQNSSIYLSLAGNWVWASGSMDWAWGLSPGGSTHGGNNVRYGLRVITRNIFDRMILDAPKEK